MLFCTNHSIDVSNFSAPHVVGRSGHRLDDVTMEHYYHFDIFNAAIDF